MLRRIPRLLRISVVMAVLVAVTASIYQSWSAGSPGLGVTQTEFGPLSANDRNLLVAVRLAGLWEGPTGQQAAQQASSADVQEVGRKLSVEHDQLDAEVIAAAGDLGVLLPASPTPTQMGWMNQISSQTGTNYDRTFVQIVRAAHGTVLPVISDVRSSTRNERVREFAELASQFVTRHHQYLEGTGLVDYAALPATQLSPMALLSGTGPQSLIIPIVVFVAVVLGAVALLAALRKKSAARPQRVTVPQARTPAAASMAAAPPMAAIAAPVAAIPGPRAVPEPTGQWTHADAGSAMPMESELRPATVSDSGTYRTVSDSDVYRAAPEADNYRPVHDVGPYRQVSDSGPYRTVADTGPYRSADPEPGPYRTVADTGPYRVASDNGARRTASTTGAYRSVSETGSHRPVSDSGFQRTETGFDTGTHRATARSGPRHSVRR